jgi:citrate lyase subunit beta/citryl-CoA lyase
MMVPRSFLFVPGDSERKLAKGETSAAHALILDLEDSVAEQNLPSARQRVREYLDAHRDRTRQQVWVRINPLDSSKALQDLAAVVGGAPDGVVLPKCESGTDILRLDHFLAALETREEVAPGSIRIMPVATESAVAMFGLGSYRGVSPRLYGLTWGAEDLAAALGAASNRDDAGAHAFPYQLARSLCVLGANAAGVHPLDTVSPDFRDLEALAAEVRRARVDGFRGKLAIHPDQVAVIHAGFRPSVSEFAHARAVVAALKAMEGAGVAQVNGVMVDKPHLTQALQILEAAGDE